MEKKLISEKIPEELLDNLVSELKDRTDLLILPESNNEYELLRVQINDSLMIIYKTGTISYHENIEIDKIIAKYSSNTKNEVKKKYNIKSIRVHLTNEQLIELEEKLAVYANKEEPKGMGERVTFSYKGSTIILYNTGTVFSPKGNDKFERTILEVIKDIPSYTNYEILVGDNNKRRIDATEVFWKANYGRNFFHIPDLYQVDPIAKDFDPYRVPSTFIPEPVGGLIEVYDTNGKKIDNESIDFILMNFLPGGYKKRWGFHLYGAIWNSFDETKLALTNLRFADISNNFLNISKEPLLKYYLKLVDNKNELFDLFNIPISETDIYYPKGIRVKKLHDKIPFYWTESINQIVHKMDDVPDLDVPNKLTRDPSSFGLWFSLFDNDFDKNVKIDEIDLSDITSGLITNCRKIIPIKLVKCYYGNLLNLYSTQSTKSVIINFYHSKDERYAIIGSKSNTHGIEFTLSLLEFKEILNEILKNKTHKEELVFSYLYKQLWYELFFKENLIECSFDIDKFFEIFIAIDYWIKSKNIASNLKEIFKEDFKKIEEILFILIPTTKKNESDTRLKYLGYDEFTRDLVISFLKHNYPKIQKIVSDIYSKKNLQKHGLEVLIHSFIHGILNWSQVLLNTNSESLIAHIDPINYKHDEVRVIFYDAIQGGSGVSSEFFSKLQARTKSIINEILTRVTCQSSIIEDILIDIISKESPDFLYDLTSNDINLMHDLVKKYLENYCENNSLLLSDEAFHEMKNRLALKLKSVTIELDMIVFYHVVTKSINKLNTILKRSTVITDVVLDISDSVFIDPRAYSMFKFYSTRNRGHISEIAYRCSEIVKQCNRACPDCLILSRCKHIYTLREYIIDRSMLEFLLKRKNGD